MISFEPEDETGDLIGMKRSMFGRAVNDYVPDTRAVDRTPSTSGANISLPGTITSTIGESGALTHAYAHVLDIELTKPVTGLLQTSNGLKARQAWALVRLFGNRSVLMS